MRLADPVGRRAIRGVIGIRPVWYVRVLRHRLHSLSARAHQRLVSPGDDRSRFFQIRAKLIRKGRQLIHSSFLPLLLLK